MRIKQIEADVSLEPTLKKKAMAHLLASCNRKECLELIGMAYDRITYHDNVEQAFKGLYGRTN